MPICEHINHYDYLVTLWQLLKEQQELLGQFSSTVEQNCIIKKADLRAKNL
jgi:hypothetical protein